MSEDIQDKSVIVSRENYIKEREKLLALRFNLFRKKTFIF